MATRRGSSQKRLITKSTGSARPATSGRQKKDVTSTLKSQGGRSNVALDKTLGQKSLLCTSCGAVYFDKHWHSPSLAGNIDRRDLAEALCEECKMGAKFDGNSKVTGFGGEIVLEGLSQPALRGEVIGLARNVANRAGRRDPEDRIIKIVDAGENVVIYTTENQLAVSIGKQIHSARKGGSLNITWSHQDKPVRVRWTAP